MYTQSQVTAALEAAVAQTIAIVSASPDHCTITSSQLIKMSGLTPPQDTDPIIKHNTWSLNLMYLRETWRERVLDATGRFPRTVYGHGFEILKPAENIDYAAAKASKDIVKAIRKSSNILTKTRDVDLNMQERQRKINHQVRLGALEGSAHKSARDAERDKLTVESTPNIKLPTQTFSE